MAYEKKNTFYVTTPLYYVTARPHIGTLYSTLLADAFARWNKLIGNDVFFQTGTDEHGQKIAQAAEKAGKTSKEFVDTFVPQYKKMWQEYAIDYTQFFRTTDATHAQAVQQWIEQLKQQGDIYKGFYKGWYCVSDEAFVSEQAFSDEHAPVCPDCGKKTVLMSEETYFFRLSAYQDKLLQFYEQNPNFIVPKERMHEVVNFVKRGLKDLSISRTTIDWGIPFPGDPEHVVYVWGDALNNYITGVGYGQQGKEQEFAHWWPANMQILGKDIVRFHAVYWPAFLMAAGLSLPKKLLVHGWITVDKQKMSKSLGNVVDPKVLAKTYGVDQVRYYLLRHMSVTQDGDFSIAELEQRISSDLANDLGNLFNRMVTLAHKYEMVSLEAPQQWSAAACSLQNSAKAMVREVQRYMNEGFVDRALASVWSFIKAVNGFFHAQEPWRQAKKDTDAFAQTLSATAHSLHTVALLLWPTMPDKMEQLLHGLGMPLDLSSCNILTGDQWNRVFTVHKIAPLFVKPERNQKKQDENAMKTAEKEEEKSYITIDDLVKVELVVGTIEQAEAIEGSDKLVKMQVDCGSYGKRQILAGVKKFYTPEQLQGMQGVFVVNLKPRKMMGVESQGMMLFAEAQDGTLAPVTVAKAVPAGARLR